MRLLIRLWPAAAGLFLALGLLALLKVWPAQAVVQFVVHTTVADFTQGTFYRTGLTQQGDGEVTLLTVGISGQWITTTNATGFIPRSEHAAVVVNNRIYVFGGRAVAGTLTSIQTATVNTANHNLSNWVTPTVSLAGVYPAGISALSAAYLNGTVYLIGGYSADESTEITSTVSFARIQPNGTLDPFARTAALPQRLSRTDVVILNGRLYVIGGRGPDSRGRNAVYYAEPNAATGQIAQWFTATGTLPYPVFGHEAFAAGGYLYFSGGVSNSVGTGGVVPNVYFAALQVDGNIAPSGWVSTTLMPFPLYEAAAVTFGGQLYSTGGSTSASLAGLPSDYVGTALPDDDGTIPQWFNTDLIFPARFAHAAVVNSDGWIYLIGGTVGSNQPITASIVNAGATTGAGGAYAKYGRYTSSIIDLTKIRPLQQLKWVTYLGNTSTVSLTMRYRYRVRDTSPWSGWSAPLPSLNVAGTLTTTYPLTPSARYFQYEASFTSTNQLTTPIVSHVELVYDRPDPPQLLKLASPPGGSSVLVGQRITYTLRYSNVSDSTFHTVVISDLVPISTTYAPGSIFAPPGVTSDPSGAPTLVWQVGDLPPHTGGDVGYAVTVDAGVPDDTQIPNIASLFSDEGDAVSAQIVHFVGQAMLVIKSSDTSAPSQAGNTVQPGDRITYTLDYQNTSDLARTGVVITDRLPLHLSYVSGIGPIDTSLLSSGILRWNVGSVPPGGSGTVGFVAAVQTSAPHGSLIDNAGQIDSNETGSSTSLTLTHPVAYRYDLALSKSDGRVTAPPGSVLTYTLRLTNTATFPVTATGIIITDYIEAGLPGLTQTVLSFAGGTPGWSFAESGPGYVAYRNVVGSLPPNQSRAITIVVRLTDALPPGVLAIRNSAEMYDDGQGGVELDILNQCCASDIDIVAGPDLIVTGISQLGTSTQPATFVVTLKNQGLDPTRGPDNNGWFTTDLYIKPAGDAAPFGPADRYLGACPTQTNPCANVRDSLYRFTKAFGGAGLAPDETWTLTYMFPLTAGQTFWVYAQADVYWADPAPMWGTAQNGRMIEGDEANNIAGPLIVGSGGPGDKKVFLPIVRK